MGFVSGTPGLSPWRRTSLAPQKAGDNAAHMLPTEASALRPARLWAALPSSICTWDVFWFHAVCWAAFQKKDLSLFFGTQAEPWHCHLGSACYYVCFQSAFSPQPSRAHKPSFFLENRLCLWTETKSGLCARRWRGLLASGAVFLSRLCLWVRLTSFGICLTAAPQPSFCSPVSSPPQ